MRKILATMFVLALVAAAFAGPPIDYELNCETPGDPDPVQQLVGVLSVTEGGLHVALIEGAESFGCVLDEGSVTLILEGEPTLTVAITWVDGQPVVEVKQGDEPLRIDLVVVPQVAIDGMLTAQRLRAAAMEMRREAAERGETDRDRTSWDDEGAPGSGEPGDPPVDVPPGDGPGGPPDETPRGDGTGEGSGRRP